MATVAAGSRKRYYRRNNYGKFYSYRRIRNIMNTYFRAKCSIQVDVTWANNIVALHPLGAQNANQIWALAELVIGSVSWLGYRGIFTFYKPRGVLIEAEPKFQNTAYFDTQNNVAHAPYSGDVAIGLNNANQVPAYQNLVDSNHFLVLSTVSKQRVYWPFTIKDFTELPAPGANANAVPYWLIIAQNGAVQLNAILPTWSLRRTCYMTFRQSTL